MNIPSAAFVRNDPNLPNFIDDRRPVGRFSTGGREDGTGYMSQTIQQPVVCGVDVYEYRPSAGKASNHVTSEPRATRCPDCRERLGL